MCGSTSKNKSSSEELVTEGGADNTIKKSMAETMVHVSCDGSTNQKSFSNELVTNNMRTTKHDYSSRSPDLSRRFAPGINAEGYPVKHTLRTQYDHQQPSKGKDPLLIGIRGKWYDVTSFVQHHPGGDILLDFVGKDATSEFIAYHDEATVLKHRKPVGTYDYTPADAMDAEWLALNDKYEKLGYFETPLWFVWSRLAILLGFGIASLVCVRWHLHSPNWLVLMTGAACLAGVWQQSGFLMHDTMHNHLFHSRKIDQAFGWLFGNVLLGLSRKWWRDEHHEHHLFVNSIIEGEDATDPQMKEDAWVQDLRVASFSFAKLPPWVQHFMARYQHLYLLPVLVVAGPYAIKNASFKRETQRFELAGLVLYFVWVACLLSVFATWQEAFVFHSVAMACLGVLSIQLVISHFTKPWTDKHTRRGWARYQVESVMDIWCSPHLDWFYGGLHIHSVHHLFPRMGRCYYRQVHPEIAQLCTNHKVKLDVVSFYDGVLACIQHSKEIGEQLQVQLATAEQQQHIASTKED